MSVAVQLDEARIEKPPRSRFWHITSDKDFQLDPEKGGLWAFGGGTPTKDLFLANEDTLYLWSSSSYLKGRKWAVEVDIRGAGSVVHTGDNGVIPGQFSADPKKVKVLRIVPISTALKDAEKVKKAKSDWLTKYVVYDYPKGGSTYGGKQLIWRHSGERYTFADTKKYSSLPPNVVNRRG